MALIPKRAAVVAAALAVGALGVGGAVAAPAGAATCTGADVALNHSSAAALAAAESGLACLVNNARAAAGLPALAVKSDLTSVARTRAADFAAGGNNYACNKIAGWSTCWESWAHWYPAPTATTAFNGWMGDAGARSRILNTAVTELGIGIVNGNRTEGVSGSGATFDMVEVKRSAPAPAPAPTDPSGCVSSDYDKTVNTLTQSAAEKAVFCLTNEQRKANGKPAYTASSLLGGTARAHAQAAADIKWWTTDGSTDMHTNPQTGSTPDSRIRAAGYCSTGTSYADGENAFGSVGTGGTFPPTPRGAVNWWMQSAGHRANILSDSFKELGVGVVAASAFKSLTGSPAGTFIQNFGRCS